MPLFGPPDIGKLEARRDIKGLIKALSDRKDCITCHLAAAALGRVGNASAVEALIAALEDGFDSVRHAAIEALGNIGDARAIEPLRRMLQDKDDVARRSTAQALGKFHAVRASELLLSALQDEDWHVRLFAAEGLASTGDPRGIDVLTEALTHREEGVVRHAVRALNNTGWKPGRDAQGAIYWIRKGEWSKCIEIGAAAAGPLVDKLKDKDPNISRLAAETLGRIGTPAIDTLVAFLSEEEFEARKDAIDILGKIGDARAVPALISQLKHSNFFVRMRAADALEKVGWQPGVDEAGACYWLSKQNFSKCVDIGAPAVQPLIDLLNNKTYDGQLFIIEAMGLISDPRAVEPLIELLRTRHYKAAAKALVQIYRSGKPDPAQAARILAQREQITNHHIDQRSSCAPNKHEDYNAGVAFPL